MTDKIKPSAEGIQPQTQGKSSEWSEQWSMFQDDERFLFNDWILPATLEDFKGKDVLECGCGGGQHTSFVAPFAKSVTAVDLNTVDIAKERNRNNKNVTFVEADLATMDLGRTFDIVYCIGVIHHTDDPTKTFDNLYRHCKPGGLMIIWTYSAEGNFLVSTVVEPVRKVFLSGLSRSSLLSISKLITALLYPFVYTFYQLPFLSFLPYFEYFDNFRKLSFERNVLNVFDKLNAPQTYFTTYETCKRWFSPSRFEEGSISIKSYKGVSWSLNGIKKLVKE